MRLIVGCGNTDRSDDAAGILVARRLRARGFQAVEHTGDGLALIELWHGFDDVVLVDAMLSGATPGSVRVWDPVAQPLCSQNWRSSSHAFGPAEAIELARVIGRLPDQIRVYGIEGANFEPGAEPSSEVLGAVDQVERRIAGAVSAG